jgi:hypothetical protein
MLLFLFTLACSGDDSGSYTQIDPPPFGTIEDTGTDDSGAATCGATELCERSIQECGVTLEQAECEAWYEQGVCADMAAYEACNCECLGEAACDGYFACGEICFDLHC